MREFITSNANNAKDQFFEKANEAIDAGLFWRGNLAKAVRQKDFKGTLWGVSVLSFFLFLYVWQHMEVVKLGYDVQALRQQKQQLTNEYYYLKYKMNDMNSLVRVEQIAHDQLGMQTPTSDQVVILDDSFSILPKWFLFWEKTTDPHFGSVLSNLVARPDASQQMAAAPKQAPGSQP